MLQYSYNVSIVNVRVPVYRKNNRDAGRKVATEGHRQKLVLIIYCVENMNMWKLRRKMLRDMKIQNAVNLFYKNIGIYDIITI